MGPLSGIRFIEMAGIGPVPLCAMILSDLGADIIRIDRVAGAASAPRLRKGDTRYTLRGRLSVGLDLKRPEAVETLLRLIGVADGLLEGFRPGVMERLGLGPESAMKRNPRLVYGRMTGWGQNGPLAHAAGHDINYLALTGALHAIGPRECKPSIPLNLVGDYGGGTMFLAVGLLAGLLEARVSGRGQVVDAAVTDGTVTLMAAAYSLFNTGGWRDQRGVNLLDGGAHFYNVYATLDGKFISVGSIEPQFYAILRERAGLSDPMFDQQMNQEQWPTLEEKLSAIFKTKTRGEWCAIFEGTDACFAPVLSMHEAPQHPHNVARGLFVERDGALQPSPAPRFSRTPGGIQGPPANPGADTERALGKWGFSQEEIAKLRRANAI